jgi:hypothetical protein
VIMNDIERVKKIQFIVKKSDEYIFDTQDVESPSAISDIFSFNSWMHVQRIFNCSKNLHGYADNASGITFPDEAAEFGEIQAGIKIYNPIHEVELDVQAFKLLTNYYFSEIVSFAKKNNDKILKTSFGKSLLEYTSEAKNLG